MKVEKRVEITSLTVVFENPKDIEIATIALEAAVGALRQLYSNTYYNTLYLQDLLNKLKG